jgi:hypothetical protein
LERAREKIGDLALGSVVAKTYVDPTKDIMLQATSKGLSSSEEGDMGFYWRVTRTRAHSLFIKEVGM